MARMRSEGPEITPPGTISASAAEQRAARYFAFASGTRTPPN
jgi:hypothetical protein